MISKPKELDSENEKLIDENLIKEINKLKENIKLKINQKINELAKTKQK